MLEFDEKRFPHETIDGETMIIDAISGQLIMIGGGGPTILDIVRRGISRVDLLSAVGERYGRDIANGVLSFIDELIASGMLAEKEQIKLSDSVSASPDVPDLQDVSWPASLSLPVIERYNDVAEIIAMDPIHDVDASGWPKKIS